MPGESQQNQQQTQAVDVDGSTVISQVLCDLLNAFGGLPRGKTVQFSTLDAKGGIALFPVAGAVIQSNKKDITGHVTQRGIYPFSLVYRVATRKEAHRMKAKELLETVGLWLERQPVEIGATQYHLENYPDLHSGNRKIDTITRTSPAFCYAATQDGVEDWTITGQLIYINEFDL